MSATSLPPCGLYRTTAPLGDDVPAGRLVYFHNHGDPGPGVYFPSSWTLNRAHFEDRGFPLPEPLPEMARRLDPLAPEGFYRVVESFPCCAKECRTFETDLLVQLGYNGAGEAILFVPELGDHGLAIPATGVAVDQDRLTNLSPVKIAASEEAPESAGDAGTTLH